MCGIAGIIDSRGHSGDIHAIKRMVRVIEHRGPDDEGFFINRTSPELHDRRWKTCGGLGNALLGHRRLSIIDLSTGHQPLSNEDGTLWITFNGEIYNYKALRQALQKKGHRFASQSDTEVIIHAYEQWGKDCVKQLRGMFAFAIWDENSKTLFAARDRLGIKPFYYTVADGKFLFASELKSILQLDLIPRQIRSESLSDYFALMYVPAPHTIFKNIYKLLPGHRLIFRSGDLTIDEYWDIDFSITEKYPEEEWCGRIIDKLTESIKLRMISDVPLGAFLSGGVDSSAVVALMSSLQSDPIKTSSIGFAEKQFNETPFARSVADQFNTDHSETIVTPDAVNILNRLTFYFDEPFADSSAIPTYYVSKNARERVTVALSGDGGDENFAGYRRYYYDWLENRLRRLFPECVRRGLVVRLAEHYPKGDRLPQFLRAKTLLKNLSMDPAQGYFNTMSWFQNSGDILSPEIRRELSGYDSSGLFHHYFERAKTSDPLSRIQYLDIKTYLSDDILTKVDRASMANSLEVRVPVLDHEFMELVATIPSSLKLKSRQGKYIFKKALSPYLSDETLFRNKMGFSIPLSKWLKTDLKPIFERQVFSKNGYSKAFVNIDVVRNMWQLHLGGKFDFASELWAVLFFETWARKWM